MDTDATRIISVLIGVYPCMFLFFRIETLLPRAADQFDGVWTRRKKRKEE